MRVAIAVWKLFPSFVGGAERHSRELAKSLATLGNEVDVLCADVPHGDDLDRLPFRIIPLGWQEHVPNLIAERVFSSRVAHQITVGKYDVAYGENLALWQYVGRKTVPCVMNPHGLEPMKVRGLLARARGSVRRRAFRYTAQHSDLTISLGGRLTQEVQQLLRVKSNRVVCLPNGVDLEALDLQRLTGISKLPGSLLYVGRLAPNKGVDVLIRAFEILEGRCCARLYIIGDGPLRERLTKNLPRNVVFMGRLPDNELARWYQRVEALVLPSLFEGMPTVILEAMGYGLPIIATDVGSVATLVDRANGLVVPPRSSDALVQAVYDFVKLDPGAKARLGKESRNRVESQFTWPAIAKQTQVLLQELAQDTSARA